MTTTVRLSQELKARIARAAEREGTTAHNFVIEAIKEKTEQAERRAEFHALAEQRHKNILANGRSVPWVAMREYLHARAAGKPVKRPTAKNLAR